LKKLKAMWKKDAMLAAKARRTLAKRKELLSMARHKEVEAKKLVKPKVIRKRQAARRKVLMNATKARKVNKLKAIRQNHALMAAKAPRPVIVKKTRATTKRAVTRDGRAIAMRILAAAGSVQGKRAARADLRAKKRAARRARRAARAKKRAKRRAARRARRAARAKKRAKRRSALSSPTLAQLRLTSTGLAGSTTWMRTSTMTAPPTTP